MREIPALFSAPMARANLAGTKTQTRRPLYVLQKLRATSSYMPNHEPPLMLPKLGMSWALGQWHKAKPGERIWQRETWKRGCGHTDDDTVCVAYAASQEPEKHGLLVDNITRPAAVDMATWEEDDKWRPSIHMPRWACRFIATITEVRIERLQAISEADAIAEGIESSCGFFRNYLDASELVRARESYRSLWDSINGDACSWLSNPWVVAISYERIKP